MINAKDMFAAAEFADERAYYRGQLGSVVGTRRRRPRARDWTAGLAVYDISQPAAPRRIGFMPVEGGGIHRIWYTGGRWAYVSALLDGFTDYIFMTVDMATRRKPREAGRYWIPGMNQAAGETPTWPAASRYGLHHAIVHGDTAYAAWRDAGMVVLDVADREKPEAHRPPQLVPAVRRRNAQLPAAAGSRSAGGARRGGARSSGGRAQAHLDVRQPRTCQSGEHRDLSDSRRRPTTTAKGGHFGPHNIHENRPGSFVSSELIFATYQNAGVRVFDIRDQYRPSEVGAWVPPAPARMMDHRPNRARVIQSADVFVDATA